jgi:hypothetical protein
VTIKDSAGATVSVDELRGENHEGHDHD